MIGVYEFTKHIFGVNSSPACAIYAFLQAGVVNNESHSVAAKAIKRTFYMDNFAKPVATLEEAIQIYKDVQTTLKPGGFFDEVDLQQ